ncbi:Uncharacterised protein [Streptococcus mutans]|uniref:Uncharacterized protein n=1 Tax=Streptococcus ratti FA-1 = DSM 20564 TaxID=699248 RepID=A0ABN0GV63_STRRT|nr:hypothetical protein SRA_06106 [Streptococcus ratti FA-1 = DSM 20564]VEI60387.1 Uncharacterised protein [Streptococcus mutans]
MTFEQLLYAEILAQHHSIQKAADITAEIQSFQA